MFKFLKEKLKGALNKFTKKVDEEAKTEEVEVKIEEPAKIEEKKSKEVKIVDEKTAEVVETIKEEKEDKREAEERHIIEEEKKAEKEEEKEEKEIKEITAEKHDIKEQEKKIEKAVKEAEAEEKQEKKEEKTEEKKEAREKTEKKIEEKKEAKKIEEKKPEEKAEEIAEEHTENKEEAEKPAKKGFFARLTEKITTKKLGSAQFEELFWELEMALLESNVAVEVIEKLKKDLSAELVDKQIPRSNVEKTIETTLRKSIMELFEKPNFDFIKKIKSKKPFVIVFAGVNGSGKTTTIAKMTKLLLDNKLSVVMAAGDTFRAAAIDQLQLHADKLGVKLIKHDYGADAAAVAFDAIEHATAKGKDVVLIDTAGRLHSNANLMDEMKKIIRVAKPDMKLFIGESITGNDCVEQAQKFNEAIGIDGILLAKSDVDEKGGAALSIGYVTKKPILFLGTGQEYGDLKPFDPKSLVETMGL